ncbi:hypothetical protein BD779DRAFT_1472126 [Infundibulicybe gibba]|nr:hypothetical protein BD779DRAFT_1472126 [Infundibulicybe gibba]
MGISSPASQPGSIFPSENFQPSAVQYNSQPSARVQHNQLPPALSDPPPDSIEDESDNLSENDGDPTIEKCTPEEYLLTKGRIIGRYRLMWRPFRPIIEDGLICSSKDANPRSFSSRYSESKYCRQTEVVRSHRILPSLVGTTSPPPTAGLDPSSHGLRALGYPKYTITVVPPYIVGLIEAAASLTQALHSFTTILPPFSSEATVTTVPPLAPNCRPKRPSNHHRDNRKGSPAERVCDKPPVSPPPAAGTLLPGERV